MPIVRRTADGCFEEFRSHVSSLLQSVLPGQFVVGYVGRGSRRTIAFLSGGPTTIPLKTNVGSLHFYVAQSLEAVREGRRRYRLRTRQYWYRLQSFPGLNEQAIVRWEYDSALSPREAAHCRHHVQFDVKLKTNVAEIDLNRAHTPTGWVTIEEVVRFLIAELGVVPRCGKEWPAILVPSETAFYEEFTSKRYKQ